MVRRVKITTFNHLSIPSKLPAQSAALIKKFKKNGQKY